MSDYERYCEPCEHNIEAGVACEDQSDCPMLRDQKTDDSITMTQLLVNRDQLESDFH